MPPTTACLKLLAFHSLATFVPAFPVYQVAYYSENDNDCSDSISMGWEWDLAEDCFTFQPTKGVTAGQDDSVSFISLTNDNKTLTYGYHPLASDCSNAAGATKIATQGECTYQTEGQNYYLDITCIQATAEDPACEPFEFNLDTASDATTLAVTAACFAFVAFAF